MPSNGNQRYTSAEQRKRRILRFIIEFVVCAVLIIPTLFPPACDLVKNIIQKKITRAITLQPDSAGLTSWLNPPVDTIRNYYLFNITNPVDVTVDPSDTPINVQDTPGYAYKIKTIKQNLQWSDKNTKLSYAVERLITRDPENFRESAVNDEGVFINLLRALVRTKYERKPADTFFIMGGTDPFSRSKPIDLLEGFTSELFKRVQEQMIGPNTNLSGFIYRQNGSSLYNVSIDTNLDRKGQVMTFSSELVPFSISSPKQFPFPIYDSVTYPHMLFDKPVLNIFHADFCRPILLQYKQTVDLYPDMSAFEYRVKFIDINKCIDPSDTTTCEEVEKLDVSTCISASLPPNTMFLSKAHFYGSTPETIEKMKIQGLNASSEKHDSVVYFEPYSGTPLKASFRMQLNVQAAIDPMRLDDDRYEWRKKKAVDRLIPIFWIDQDIQLHQEKIDELRIGRKLMKYSKWIFFGLAVVISICFIIIMEVCARCSDRKRQNTHKGYVKADTLVYR